MRPRRRLLRLVLASALAGTLVGTVSACTTDPAGAAGGEPPAVAGTGTAPADPPAADVRARGAGLTVNDVTLSSVTEPTIDAAPRQDPDGSVHLRLLVLATGDASGSRTAGPTPTPPEPLPAAPLAWLTGPAGSTVSVLEDGSAVVSGADGSFLLGLAAPTPSARFTVVGTPAEVLRIDRVAAGAPASTAPAGPVTTWVSGAAVASATWDRAEGGRSLEVTPSEWARSGSLAAQQALWSQLVAQQPEANSPTMREQLVCHELGAPTKPTWNLEPWRPQVDAVTMLRTLCNPTAADAAAAPAPTAAIG